MLFRLLFLPRFRLVIRLLGGDVPVLLDGGVVRRLRFQSLIQGLFQIILRQFLDLGAGQRLAALDILLQVRAERAMFFRDVPHGAEARHLAREEAFEPRDALPDVGLFLRRAFLLVAGKAKPQVHFAEILQLALSLRLERAADFDHFPEQPGRHIIQRQGGGLFIRHAGRLRLFLRRCPLLGLQPLPLACLGPLPVAVDGLVEFIHEVKAVPRVVQIRHPTRKVRLLGHKVNHFVRQGIADHRLKAGGLPDLLRLLFHFLEKLVPAALLNGVVPDPVRDAVVSLRQGDRVEYVLLLLLRLPGPGAGGSGKDGVQRVRQRIIAVVRQVEIVGFRLLPPDKAVVPRLELLVGGGLPYPVLLHPQESVQRLLGRLIDERLELSGLSELFCAPFRFLENGVIILLAAQKLVAILLRDSGIGQRPGKRLPEGTVMIDLSVNDGESLSRHILRERQQLLADRGFCVVGIWHRYPSFLICSILDRPAAGPPAGDPRGSVSFTCPSPCRRVRPAPSPCSPSNSPGAGSGR